MQIHNLIQGSAEWHAYRRNHFNASDAPAMMACSSYKSRSELVREMATGIVPEVDAATQRRFDDGHRFEALARDHIAEKLIGDQLSPIVGALGKYSASFDGLTMFNDVAFEHKTLNNCLRAAMFDGCTGADLPMQYQVQMEQQCMVAGCEKVLFVASKWEDDGLADQLVEERHCWYTPNPELRAQIVTGWELLEQDVAAYVPAPAEKPAAKLQQGLPALRIDAKGEITASNLDEFQVIVLGRINSINTALQTDQHFADADSDAKFLREVAEGMKRAAKMVRSNMQTVDDALIVLEQLEKIATQKAIDLEKQVKTEKEARKEEIIQTAQQELDQHIAGLNLSLGANYLPRLSGVFGPVTKGLKSFQSMEDKVKAALATAQADANAAAQRLTANREHLQQDNGDWITLFPDFATVGAKASEDFQAVAALRIGNYRRAEQARLDTERERIRAEEQAKAQREAAEKLAQERTQAARLERERIAAELQANASAVAAITRAAAAPAPEVPATSTPQQEDDGERINLSAIKEYIHPLSIDAAGLEQFGFAPVAVVKASKQYRICDLPAIRAALIEHLVNLPELQAA